MVAPLSRDLRRRLVQAIDAGSSARQAAVRLAVSPSAAQRRRRRVRTTGSLAPARIGGDRTPLLTKQEDLLRALATGRKGITLAQIRDELAGRGIEAGSLTTILSTLRRLGLSPEKRR